MNTRNEIKITFGTPKYFVYGAEIKCYMPFEVKLPSLLEQIATLLIDKKIISNLPKGVKVMAYKHPEDVWDENKGLKVATAKAEIAVYTQVNNWLVDLNNILVDKVCYKVDDFSLKVDQVVSHDVEFIQQF